MPLGNPPYTNRLSKPRIQARRWLSSAGVEIACYSCSSALTSNGHNLEPGDTCNLTATKPLLGPLTYESTTWVHPLLEGSPAIDQVLSCPA